MYFDVYDPRFKLFRVYSVPNPNLIAYFIIGDKFSSKKLVNGDNTRVCYLL